MILSDSRSRRRRLGGGALAATALIAGGVFLGACGDSTPTSGAALDPQKLTGTLNFVNFEGWLGKGEQAAFEAKFPGAKLKQIPIAGTQETGCRRSRTVVVTTTSRWSTATPSRSS